jgi:hypothetical protein
VHVALAGLGLQHVLIGHDELTQTIHYLGEDVGRDNTIAQDLLTLSCRYRVLCGSDCMNNTLWDVIRVKRGDTVGLALTTYMGHAKVESTFWYLESTPELMADIAQCAAAFVYGGGQ